MAYSWQFPIVLRHWVRWCMVSLLRWFVAMVATSSEDLAWWTTDDKCFSLKINCLGCIWTANWHFWSCFFPYYFAFFGSIFSDIWSGSLFANRHMFGQCNWQFKFCNLYIWHSIWCIFRLFLEYTRMPGFYLTFYLAINLAFYLTYILDTLSEIYSGILSDILSGIRSCITPQTVWPHWGVLTVGVN